MIDRNILSLVFGSSSTGDTAHERACTSDVSFVRSQDHIGYWSPSAKGHRLTAREALAAYGLDVLREAVDKGAAILPVHRNEPASSLQSQRERLGLTIQDVARSANVEVGDVMDCENPSTRSSIHLLEQIAPVLGLDEQKLTVSPGAGADEALAVRMRTLGDELAEFSPRVVSTLAESAWVANTQKRLESALDSTSKIPAAIVPSSRYSSRAFAPWYYGYELANRTREILGIAPSVPIENLRELCEHIGVPVIQASLPRRFAGATLATEKCRSIVVNVEGYNENVWVRRATIAHELGHLLWDPTERLERLRVDEYEATVGVGTALERDEVEARANAFAIQLLAPSGTVAELCRDKASLSDGVRVVMETFGISATAARYHVWNALKRSVPLEQLNVDDLDPTDEWKGRESFTVDFFPFGDTPYVRRGRFSGVVAAAEISGLISVDTAVRYLNAPGHDAYMRDRDMILSLFPECMPKL